VEEELTKELKKVGARVHTLLLLLLLLLLHGGGDGGWWYLE
jgi:hypothetical protein